MDQALVIGASGFVGRRLLANLGERGVGTHRDRPTPSTIRFDATTERLRDRLAGLPAGLTHVFVPFGAIDMEGCAADYDATARVNVEAVTSVLGDALDAGLKPIFVSTDYVFSGERALWSEEDEARPRMAYGRQKLHVERWLAARGGDWLTCRLSKVLSDEAEPANMLAGWAQDLLNGRRLRVADDQYFSPADADDLAKAMILLAEVECRGLFHVAGPERLSRFELFDRLAAAMKEFAQLENAEAEACSLRAFGFLEQRPLDTSLATNRLNSAISMSFKPVDELCRAVARRYAAAR
jgi:dTDP-4-dehydrorhamnose reductase